MCVPGNATAKGLLHRSGCQALHTAALLTMPHLMRPAAGYISSLCCLNRTACPCAVSLNEKKLEIHEGHNDLEVIPYVERGEFLLLLQRHREGLGNAVELTTGGVPSSGQLLQSLGNWRGSARTEALSPSGCSLLALSGSYGMSCGVSTSLEHACS